ncbi:UNVERIFIED_ORG: hypothetical protein B5F06_05250 [Lacrimispora saccharolytica]
MPAGIKIRCRTSELPGKLKESFPGSFSVFFHALKNFTDSPFSLFLFYKTFHSLDRSCPAMKL